MAYIYAYMYMPIYVILVKSCINPTRVVYGCQ